MQLESNQADAWLGRSVSGAGDVNGDGYADVIVGAFWYDAGETDEGAAFVFLPEPSRWLLLAVGLGCLVALYLLGLPQGANPRGFDRIEPSPT